MTQRTARRGILGVSLSALLLLAILLLFFAVRGRVDRAEPVASVALQESDPVAAMPTIELARGERIVENGAMWWVWLDPNTAPADWPLVSPPSDDLALATFSARPADRFAEWAVDLFDADRAARYPGRWIRDIRAPIVARGSAMHASMADDRMRAESRRRRDGRESSDVVFVYDTGVGSAAETPRYSPEMPEPGLANLYACTAFEVADPGQYLALHLEGQFATGVIWYINGEEVARHHVVPGAEAHGRLSTHYWLPDHVFQMMYGRWQRSWLGIDPSMLRAGTNMLCAVVYKRDTAGERALFVDAFLEAHRAPGMTKTPYLQRVEHHRITVMWETNFDGFGYVEYGETGQPLTRVASSPQYADTHHEVVLTGLDADRRYTYRAVTVPTAGVDASPIVSDEGHFWTAVAPGTSYTFLAYGDNRTQSTIHAAVAARMWEDTQEAAARFVVHTGDLVTNASPWYEWQNEFFEPALALMREMPYYTSLGNHEGNHESYYYYLDLPGNESWYSFSYGDVDFFALNSSADFEPGSPQNLWLESALQSSTSIWKVVFFHHPPYACTPSRKPGDLEVQSYIVPLMEAYGVDLVLLGHDHLYGRTGIRNGVMYVISGGGGAPSYPAEPDEINEICLREFHYCRIDVSPVMLHLQAIASDGRLIDTFTLTKP